MTHCTEKCSPSLVASPVGLTDAFVQTVRRWLQNKRLRAAIQRERAHLLTMSDAMLKDIGIDRATADQEARRDDIPQGRER